jgi:hypothetical protein
VRQMSLVTVFVRLVLTLVGTFELRLRFRKEAKRTRDKSTSQVD